VLGLAVEPGTPTILGLLNLDPLLLVSCRAGFTNGFGEDLVRIPLPPGLAPGLSVTFQGIVADPGHPAGATLTNPERIVLIP
jgi:hypothetical protein